MCGGGESVRDRSLVFSFVFWCSLLCFGVLFCVLVFSFVFWCSRLCFGVLVCVLVFIFCVLVFSFVFWCSLLCFGLREIFRTPNKKKCGRKGT